MNQKEIKKDLEKHLSKERFTHTLGVVKAAKKLAKHYGLDEEKAGLAALLHDAAKGMKLHDMQVLTDPYSGYKDEEMNKNHALLHGLAGMVLAKEKYGIHDEMILEAIRVHTTGKVGMTAFDAIIFLADAIEENREYEGVEELRKLAFFDLVKALILGYDMTICHVIAKGWPLYVTTVLARNDIVERKQL